MKTATEIADLFANADGLDREQARKLARRIKHFHAQFLIHSSGERDARGTHEFNDSAIISARLLSAAIEIGLSTDGLEALAHFAGRNAAEMIREAGNGADFDVWILLLRNGNSRVEGDWSREELSPRAEQALTLVFDGSDETGVALVLPASKLISAILD